MTKLSRLLTLGAVQNKKKTEHGDEATAKIFSLKLIIFLKYFTQLFYLALPVKNVISKLILFVSSGHKNITCNDCFGAFLVWNATF